MPKTTTHPVTTARLPVVRCTRCGRPFAHQPRKGAASKVLTDHYNEVHAGEPISA